MPLPRSLHPGVLTSPPAPLPPSPGGFLAAEVAEEGLEVAEEGLEVAKEGLEEEGPLARAHELQQAATASPHPAPRKVPSPRRASPEREASSGPAVSLQ